jgi:hypothetical protein
MDVTTRLGITSNNSFTSYRNRRLQCDITNKGKGKGHPRTGHEGPEVEWRYSSTVFNLGTKWGGVNATPRPLYPREISGTHCTGGCVGPSAGLDRCGKCRPLTVIRSPDRPACSESLYRMGYPGPQHNYTQVNFFGVLHDSCHEMGRLMLALCVIRVQCSERRQKETFACCNASLPLHVATSK